MPVPHSTYRLQITDRFTLFDAAALTGYLADLGVAAVYVSPLLKAVPGSDHGYDVVDHREVDPARGGEAGLRALADACRERGLQLIVDIVPNHMGVAVPPANPAWWDVLMHGRQSAHARWFDVDWAYADGRILLPVLGDDADLDTDLQVIDGELRYFEHRFPLAPGSWSAGESARAVHDRQNYRLVNFRLADTEQNYRRFFAVTELAGLRVEDADVFDETHAEILRWVGEYGVTGLRIDHPDGLADPGGYLDRLAAAAPDAWLTVEKITEPGEQLPASWPVGGMTGYDALAEVNALLVDPAAEGTMTQIYQDLTGDQHDWPAHVRDGKQQVATTILQAELRRVARLVPEVDDSIAALTELAIAFAVYRSYLPRGAEYLQAAVEIARTRRPELSGAIEQLLPRLTDPGDEVCVRFQQVTGAVTAKGVEDTAYYRYSRFIALNEVGGFPETFGSGVADFHQAQLRRLDYSPHGMTTLSTHDTKRGEDVRANLAVLAELPEEWAEAAGRLMKLAPVPDPAFGYLLWQTFAAVGLIERERMHAYAEKAMREAARGTGWIDPEPDFEDTVHAAVDSAYDQAEVRDLVAGIHRRIEPFGRVNSLAQKLVQLTMPGVPDVYQGTELWDDSLVDPDNRRAVDFGRRAEQLAALTAAGPTPRIDDSGAAKLLVATRALRARAEHPELFTGYTPLLVDGAAQDHLIAFDRGGAITLATRLPAGVEALGGWVDTVITLPVGRHSDVLTGQEYTGEVRVAELFGALPVALLLTVER